MSMQTIEKKKSKEKAIRPGKNPVPGQIKKSTAIKALIRNDLTKIKNPIYLNLEQKIIVRDLIYTKLQIIASDTQFSREDSQVTKSVLSLHYEEQIKQMEQILYQLYQ